jgi:cytochrome c oxidase subunit 2
MPRLAVRRIGEATQKGEHNMQEIAWQASLILMALVGLGFAFVAINSGRRYEDYAPLQKRAYRLRLVLFWGVVMVFGPTMIYTLVNLPYDAAHARGVEDARPPQVIQATGYLWYWELSETEIVAGHPVEFRVTSADVNHGFGVYGTDMKLVAQVQAMPGYINTLRHTFEQPGTYRIMCLEYCGTVHHAMVTELTVAGQ